MHTKERERYVHIFIRKEGIGGKEIQPPPVPILQLKN